MCNFDHFMYFALFEIAKKFCFLFIFSFAPLFPCDFNDKIHFHGLKNIFFVFENGFCSYFINFSFNFCTHFTIFNSFYAK